LLHVSIKSSNKFFDHTSLKVVPLLTIILNLLVMVQEDVIFYDTDDDEGVFFDSSDDEECVFFDSSDRLSEEWLQKCKNNFHHLELP